MQMSRRPINPSRRASESGKTPQSVFFIHSRSRSRPYLSIAAVVLGAFLLIGYLYRGKGTLQNSRAISWVQGDFSCHDEVLRAIPILKEAYGDSMHKVLHVGPDTCSVTSALSKEEETEAWGVEPYDIEDADLTCRTLVHRGIVRVADITFPLPYRAKSFLLAIVSDALDYLSPKYLNRTIPEMARMSSTGLVIFTRYPRHQRSKEAEKDRGGHKFKSRNSTWWTTYFAELSLEENETAAKKFQKASEKLAFVIQIHSHLHSLKNL
ncbi:probable pectin methylesterase CGR3 isoform X2 [Andrographis paniculata]|uniref:probable pectin methylesterase CGR3 isoform X2 n=1 Tax=Andrographis paniculata TaxID=175694 RepID=UPI0021E9495E|nr:probable pectin methylesterase CGR3 isoform X2 [Andrographis paniculata]